MRIETPTSGNQYALSLCRTGLLLPMRIET